MQKYKYDEGSPVSTLLEEVHCYLLKLAPVLLQLQWLIQSLREPLVLTQGNSSKLLKVLDSHLLSFYLELSLEVIGIVCHKLVFSVHLCAGAVHT